jgi:hypothetical protein
MLDLNEASEKKDLQFDRVSRPGSSGAAGNTVSGNTAAGTTALGNTALGNTASCTACHSHISDVYYDVNGHTFCAKCRVLALSAAETPSGMGPLLRAGLFGFGGAVLGAIVYYAVLAIFDWQIGIIAILCGYLVGMGVRKGTGNRGGRRFQVLAVALTYLSIVMAFTPIAINAFIEGAKKQTAIAGSAVSGAAGTDSKSGRQTTAPNAGATTEGSSANKTEKVTVVSFVVALAVLLGLLIAVPIGAALSSMPMGLIGLAIMFFGMQQAWRMAATPKFVISGPYRVGAAPSSSVA